jgi:hypothetical protein
MLEPPFLELAYYTGRAAAEQAWRLVVPDAAVAVTPNKVSLAGAIGVSAHPEEIELARGSLIVLRGEGEPFCGPERADRRRLARLGKQVYERFVQVADLIPCVYGAILVEYSLEEPDELLADPRSLAFRDFFLKRAALSPDTVDAAIYEAGDDAFVMPTASGVYVSMSPELNPDGKGVASVEAQERSARIGSIVARAISSRSRPR